MFNFYKASEQTNKHKTKQNKTKVDVHSVIFKVVMPFWMIKRFRFGLGKPKYLNDMKITKKEKKSFIKWKRVKCRPATDWRPV